MDHLRRDLAPISAAGWEQIDDEARRSLGHFLAGRPLVEVAGPHGWEHAAESTGRMHPATPTIVSGVVADLRGVQPLVELRAPFEVALEELDGIDRGARDPDLSPVTEAARKIAEVEDRAIFHGMPSANIEGIEAATPHQAITIGPDYDEYPGAVARAVARLRAAGVGGPYGIALGPRCYTGVIETTEHGGYPVLEHLKMILGGPVIWAPAVNGAVVVSLRGGDYELSLGQDFAVGYLTHSSTAVELYVVETMTFLVREATAAIHLAYPD
jgi:uncharacterized linocin/CFP29 family protein